MGEYFEITNSTRSPTPAGIGFFRTIKEAVLSKQYELSLAFVGEKRMRALNRAHRGKNKPTNVLSFPLAQNAGEIYICLRYAKREAPDFDRSYKNYVAFLLIHGLVHLKGFDHGSKMDQVERRFQRQFGI